MVVTVVVVMVVVETSECVGLSIGEALATSKLATKDFLIQNQKYVKLISE